MIKSGMAHRASHPSLLLLSAGMLYPTLQLLSNRSSSAGTGLAGKTKRGYFSEGLSLGPACCTAANSGTGKAAVEGVQERKRWKERMRLLPFRSSLDWYQGKVLLVQVRTF